MEIKCLARAMIFIPVIDIYMVWYGIVLVLVCEHLFGSYGYCYNYMIKKYDKFLMTGEVF